jgi:hypothetical protein
MEIDGLKDVSAAETVVGNQSGRTLARKMLMNMQSNGILTKYFI